MLSAEPALVRTSLVDLATRIYGSPGIAQSMWKIVEGSRRLNDDTVIKLFLARPDVTANQRH